MKRYAAAVTLISVLAVSGCTALGGGQERQTGLEVTPRDGLSLKLSSPGSPFTEDQNVSVELLSVNTGSSNATDITVDLHGTSFLNLCSPSPKPDSWIAGTVEAANRAGGRDITLWKCGHGIDLAAGQERSFQAQADVEYDYSTYASTSATFLPSDRPINSTSKVSTRNSPAPVHASLRLMSPRPNPYFSPLSFSVTFQNVAKGEIVGGNINYSISIPAAEQRARAKGASDALETWRKSYLQGQVQVLDDSRAVNVRIPTSLDTGGEEPLHLFPGIDTPTDYRFVMNLSYRYREATSTRFRVRGLAGDEAVIPRPSEGGEDGQNGQEGGGEEGGDQFTLQEASQFCLDQKDKPFYKAVKVDGNVCTDPQALTVEQGLEGGEWVEKKDRNCMVACKYLTQKAADRICRDKKWLNGARSKSTDSGTRLCFSGSASGNMKAFSVPECPEGSSLHCKPSVIQIDSGEYVSKEQADLICRFDKGKGYEAWREGEGEAEMCMSGEKAVDVGVNLNSGNTLNLDNYSPPPYLVIEGDGKICPGGDENFLLCYKPE